MRHNDEDVRSLARLLAHLDAALRRLGRGAARRPAATSPASPARSPASAGSRRRSPASRRRSSGADAPVRRRSSSPAAGDRGHAADRGARGGRREARADFGGPPRRRDRGPSAGTAAGLRATWDAQRIAVDRAHLLRRLGRHADAAEAWAGVAAGPGRTAVVASIELAKLPEHRLGDRAGALDAAHRARRRGATGAASWACRSRRSKPTCAIDVRATQRRRPGRVA